MITIAQCRSARGLLDWTQQDLARTCGLSKTAINNFEKGHSDIKAESLRAIRAAFEAGGVEFLDEDGVRRRHERARIFSVAALEILHDDIYDALRREGGEVLVVAAGENGDEAGEDAGIRAQRARMTERRISFRIVESGRTPGGFTVYFFADRMAVVLAGGQSVVILNADAARHERRRFTALAGKAAGGADSAAPRHDRTDRS